MAHKSVVRNQACQVSSFSVRERHNERKNDEYYNGDVQLDRAHLNVHFRRCFKEDGSPETYHETFNRLLAEGKIVKHGTKADAKLFCEMVFDINTTYFDERGGYEYAKSFFEEAYRLAVKEAGSEDYIISAVMHADERNARLSEQLGRDVYHYHLHVVYVPVVEKKLYFRKNNKNPELAGKLKEVIPQISQANKWPLRVPIERDGKTYTVNSYSLLQDRYHDHMRAAGYDGFERGERGSTTEHLEVLEYKIKQDTANAKDLAADIKQKEKQIAKLDGQIAVKDNAKATIAEVNAMGKPTVLGNGFTVTADEMKKLKTLAKKAVTVQDHSAEWKKKIAKMDQQLADIKSEIKEVTKERDYWKNKFKDLEQMVKPYITAIINFPQTLKNFIDRHWQERRVQQQQKKSHNKAEGL
jgi:uncharacterized coiled-coil DUF342 family protein